MLNKIKQLVFIIIILIILISCSLLGIGDQTPYRIELDEVTALGIGLISRGGDSDEASTQTETPEYIILQENTDGTISIAEIKNKIGQTLGEDIIVSAFSRISKKYYTFTISYGWFRYVIDIETGLIYQIESPPGHWTNSPNMTFADRILQGFYPTDSGRLYFHIDEMAMSSDQIYMAEILDDSTMKIENVTPDTFSVNGFFVTPNDTILAQYNDTFVTKTINSELSYYTTAPFSDFGSIIRDKIGNIFIFDFLYSEYDFEEGFKLFLVDSNSSNLSFSEISINSASHYDSRGVHLLKDGGFIWFNNNDLIFIDNNYAVKTIDYDGRSLQNIPIEQIIVKGNYVFAETSDTNNPIMVVDLENSTIIDFPIDEQQYQLGSMYNNSESSTTVYAEIRETLTGRSEIYILDPSGTMEMVSEVEPEKIVIYLDPLSY